MNLSAQPPGDPLPLVMDAVSCPNPWARVYPDRLLSGEGEGDVGDDEEPERLA